MGRIQGVPPQRPEYLNLMETEDIPDLFVESDAIDWTRRGTTRSDSEVY